MTRRLGVIGGGGMAATMLQALADGLPHKLDHLSLLVDSSGRAAGAALLDQLAGRVAEGVALHDDFDGFMANTPDLVAECAGHGAVRQYGALVLAAGVDLIVVSVGCLADDALMQALEAAGRRGGAQMILPAGAVGGIDVLAAARLSGLESVTYTGRKPPLAWRGTAADRLVDLGALTEAVTFYEGSARDAARDYPQNANVAATVALAGAGFDATRVHLVADPALTRNVHEVTVRAGCGDFTIRLEGRPSPLNPKTSLTAGFSMARAVLNRILPVQV